MHGGSINHLINERELFLKSSPNNNLPPTNSPSESIKKQKLDGWIDDPFERKM
jgi:hypothetical protein